jgi:hypothetical protein
VAMTRLPLLIAGCPTLLLPRLPQKARADDLDPTGLMTPEGTNPPSTAARRSSRSGQRRHLPAACRDQRIAGTFAGRRRSPCCAVSGGAHVRPPNGWAILHDYPLDAWADNAHICRWARWLIVASGVPRHSR